MIEYVCIGWACTDCLMWIANDELPGDMSPEARQEWAHNVATRNDGYHITPGMPWEEHSEDCPRDRDIECDCELNYFSRNPCDVCGTYLAGERNAVSFFKET